MGLAINFIEPCRKISYEKEKHNLFAEWNIYSKYGNDKLIIIGCQLQKLEIIYCQTLNGINQIKNGNKFLNKKS